MLDVNDFVTDRGGNPNKIKESQRKRFAPEGVVDEVYTLYEEARRGILPIHGGMTKETNWFSHAARYEVMKIGSELNATLKEIGKKKKVSSFSLLSVTRIILMNMTEQRRCEWFNWTEDQPGKVQERCGGTCCPKRNPARSKSPDNWELCPWIRSCQQQWSGLPFSLLPSSFDMWPHY